MGFFNQDLQQPSGRFSGRIIIAGFIVLLGIFMYMTQTEENPITGEKQHVKLTPNQEIKLGLEAAPQMARQMGGELPENDPKVIKVNKIGQGLVSGTVANKGPWKFKFHVLSDQKTVNAFALPGGQIFITQGLLDKLKTDGQIAGVLAHEMGHVIERHSAEQMAKGQLGQFLIVAVGVGASDQNRGNTPMIVASVVNQMLQLRYGRKDESEADIWGIKLMSQMGYNPREMIDVMKVLKNEDRAGRPMEIFQSHPNPDRRIQQIEDYLKQHGDKG